MNPLLQSALGSILRLFLASLAGWFVQKGVWTADAANEYAAAGAIALLTVGWSLWIKYKNRIKFLTALESPAGTPEKVIEAKIKTGQGASL
jgi:hypothetical protein